MILTSGITRLPKFSSSLRIFWHCRDCVVPNQLQRRYLSPRSPQSSIENTSPKLKTCSRLRLGRLGRSSAGLILDNQVRCSHSLFPLSPVTPIRLSIPRAEVRALSFRAETAKPEENLTQLIFQLQMDYKRLKRVNIYDLNAAINLLEKGTRSDEHIASLISYCGVGLPDVQLDDRNLLVDRLWKFIIVSGDLGIEVFEAILKVHVENCHPSVDPLLMIQMLQSLGGKPTELVYYYSLLLFCQRGDLSASAKVISLMKTDEIVVSEKIFNALILGNARAGDLNGAKEILEIMNSNQVETSEETYVFLMQALIEAGKLEDLKNTFKVASLKSNFLNESLFKLLKTAATSNYPLSVDYVLDWITPFSSGGNDVHVVNTIKELIYCGQTLVALKVLKKFSSLVNVQRLQNQHTDDFFIEDTILANDNPLHVVNVVSCLMDDKMNDFAFNLATHYSYRMKKFDVALKLLEEMGRRRLEIRSHYFLPLIVHHFKVSGTEGLVGVLEKMSKLNVPMDWSTAYEWVIPRMFEAGISPLETAKILKVSSNASYSSGILSALLACLLKQRRITEASALVREIKGTVKKPGFLIQQLSKALLEFEERENLQENLMMSIWILRHIKQYTPSEDKNDYVGLFISRVHGSIGTAVPELWDQFLKGLADVNVSVSEEVVHSIQSNSTYRGNFRMKIDPDLNGHEKQDLRQNHRDMDVAALEGHVEELTYKSMNIRGALRRLFLKYCQSDDLQKALEVKAKFEKESAELSDGMKAALMGLYVRQKLLEPANKIYKDLRKSHSQPGEKIDVDFYKIVDLATLMMENNSIEEAISLVEKDCLDCPPPLNLRTVTRNIVCFLEALAKVEQVNAELAKQNRLKRVVDLLLDRSMADAKGAVIGILIRSYIDRGDIEKAVQEFRYYSRKYKITPCRQQLTYAVLDRLDLLEEVYQTSAAVRGEIDAKHHIAFAKSDVGNLDGAAKILLELGTNFQFIRIMKQCEFLSSRREVRKILNLAKALKMTERNHDCSKIFNIALESCKRFGDNEGYHRVVAIMQEEDIYIAPNQLNQTKSGL